ncbi:hypothetical protein [Paenibacillus oleatilyticus]|uniref:hypothetical protein n=1 Tax=Paenibacillus oleatilyticus TaxID=2594886 RepID=UPI001C1F73C2|nr:hypothetical protein [Paenibacillus oleatilyticus]MBU7319014.1 hypothetical protein [Paenibacillus oleatilyticus]
MEEIPADKDRIEAQEVLAEQLELFPSITEFDIECTLFLLDQYVYMKMLCIDFEENEDEMYKTDIEGETARRISQEETHADKTSNAVILHEHRKWVYSEYKIATKAVERAHRLLRTEDQRKAIKYRYIEGHPFMIALQFAFMSKSKLRRKLIASIPAMTDSLKLWGVLSKEWVIKATKERMEKKQTQ